MVSVRGRLELPIERPARFMVVPQCRRLPRSQAYGVHQRPLEAALSAGSCDQSCDQTRQPGGRSTWHLPEGQDASQFIESPYPDVREPHRKGSISGDGSMPGCDDVQARSDPCVPPSRSEVRSRTASIRAA